MKHTDLELEKQNAELNSRRYGSLTLMVLSRMRLDQTVVPFLGGRKENRVARSIVELT